MLENHSAGRLQSLVDCPILAVDEGGLIVSCNTAAEQLLGVPASELVARFHLESQGHDLDGVAAETLAASVGSTLGVTTLVDRDGHNVAIKASSLALDANFAGRPLTLFVLDRQYATPSAIADLASNSLSHVSQEVRAPLCVIVGYLDLLLDQYRTIRRGGLGKIVHLLRNHARWLDHLVDMLLGALDVLSGHLTIDPQPTRIDRLFEEAASTVDLLSPGMRRRLTIVLPHGGATIYADRQRVLQVLTGLLWSAVKYAPNAAELSLGATESELHWTVSIVQKGEGAPWWSHGYPAAERSSMWTIVDRGGYDLGLALAKAMIELHGGALGASSSPGRESTIWFTLPREMAPLVGEVTTAVPVPAVVPVQADNISLQ